jgi:CNT family concentrative nucleoside transporter
METAVAARAPATPQLERTPLSWRFGLVLAIGLLTAGAYALREPLGPRGVAVIGVSCFIGVAAIFSANLRAVNWRTIGWGLALQLLLALFVLKFEVFGYRPGRALFDTIAGVIERFLAFTNKGSDFVFGVLADPGDVNNAFPGRGFIFAFRALPTIIFVSSFFTVLYYLGILQVIVRGMARLMMYLMGTSGAESLSAAANVFMGQTEAPLIVKPYVPRMTQSELLAMMVGGMATVSGGIMGVYIELGARPEAILATSVMAAPCGLYLAKLLLPEMETPETRGGASVVVEQQHSNLIDAAAGGASDGLHLALNVAAMLIAFIAFIALANNVLGYWWPGVTLEVIFSKVFWPVSFLMGVEGADIPRVADLLGTKLVTNELVAYSELKKNYLGVMSDRSLTLATYALTGFANIASVGIQLGGIGGMAPGRRKDLARLGGRALLAGFLATLINAALAGMLL